MIKTCSACSHYNSRWCELHHKSIAYNRIACEHITGDSISPIETEEAVHVTRHKKPEPTPEQREKVLEVYAKTGKVNPAATAAGVSWARAKEIVEDVSPVACGPLLYDRTDEIVAELEMAIEKEQSKPDLSILHHDLEQAQQALVLLDTVRQVWGEVEPVQDAILQEYARRRAQ